LFLGTLEAYRVHIDGLEQIIHLRGGFQSLQDTNPRLALFIAWSVYSLSTFTGLSSLSFRIDYSSTANLVTERKFHPIPVDHKQKLSVLGRFDLHRNLDETIQIVKNIAVGLKTGQIHAPLQLGSVVSLGNMDQELLKLFRLPKYHGMIGRRLFIQEVWRITAMICISVVCRLHQIDPLLHNEMLSQLLLDGLLQTVDDQSHFIRTLIYCFTDSPNQLDLLMTLAIHLTLDDWSSMKLRLLSFLVSSEICQGSVQATWQSRLFSSRCSF
jgi:hypothetical protein